MARRRKTEEDAVPETAEEGSKERSALETIANYQWGYDGRTNALTRIIEDMQRIAKGAL